MNRALIWPVAILTALLLSASYLLDGPSDLDMQRAIEADLVDAQAQAQREAHDVRAELARLDAEQIRPEPAAEMARYAMLGAGK